MKSSLPCVENVDTDRCVPVTNKLLRRGEMVLAHAFRNSPVETVIFPEKKTRIKNVKEELGVHLCYTIQRGQVYTTDDMDAFLLVNVAEGSSQFLDKTVYEHCGGTRQWDFPEKTARFLSTIAAHEAQMHDEILPKTKNIHVWTLGTLPSAQGTGKGSKLMKRLIADAKSRHLPIYLETQEKKNQQFYEHLGFQTKAHRVVEGIDIWGMVYPVTPPKEKKRVLS